MKHTIAFLVGIIAGLGGLLVGACAGQAAEETVLRVGHIPNITHAQALVAHNMSREGKGWFEQRLGPGVRIEWFIYNAGPSAMEALVAGSLDLSYVGPNPAINAFVKTGGKEPKIVAGSVDGGSSLVVRPEAGITKAGDFRGKRIATPQFGNTQDVAARAWLNKNGIKVTRTGGDATVIPTPNPDQLALFKAGKLDAVWTVEPWVSRLEREAGGKVFLDQPDAVTTVLTASGKALKERRELVRKFVEAHRELTAWMKANPEEARERVRKELEELTRGSVPPELVAHAWRRMHLVTELNLADLKEFVENAKAAGFLKESAEVTGISEKP